MPDTNFALLIAKRLLCWMMLEKIVMHCYKKMAKIVSILDIFEKLRNNKICSGASNKIVLVCYRRVIKCAEYPPLMINILANFLHSIIFLNYPPPVLPLAENFS